MSSLRARLVRRWLALVLKRKFSRSTSAAELRRIIDQATRWSWRPAHVALERTNVGGCPADCHAPENTAGDHLLLYLHGGGYNFGSAANYRELGSRLALSCRARVLMPDYRLAPEHPYPAAVEDAVACYRWLLDQPVPPARIALAGDSAGGGLTLALLFRLKQEGLPLPAAAVCLSPWADLSCSGETYEQLQDVDPMLTRNVLRACAQRYAAGREVSDPLLSPVHGDFSGLPPLLIHVGTDEILLGDSRRVDQAARAAGVDVQLVVLQGLWHVCHLFATAVPEARAAIDDVGLFLREKWRCG